MSLFQSKQMNGVGFEPDIAEHHGRQISKWVADVITRHNGMMTSANLGSTLVAEDPERYGIIKAVFGGLCGLLTRYPERFALLNNQPLNHVVVIGSSSRPSPFLQTAPHMYQRPSSDHSFAASAPSSAPSTSNYGLRNRYDLPSHNATKRLSMTPIRQRATSATINPAFSSLFTEHDEIEVVRHTREILQAASEHALKAVDLANALRNRVGVAALGRIRQTQGGLLSLLERHPADVHVHRVPKHDIVYLVNKKKRAPSLFNPRLTAIEPIAPTNSFIPTTRHLSLFFNPDIPVDATPTMGRSDNNHFNAMPELDSSDDISDVESEPPLERRHTIDEILDEERMINIDPFDVTFKRRGSFDESGSHETSPPPPALTAIWSCSETRLQKESDERSTMNSSRGSSSPASSVTRNSESGGCFDKTVSPSVIGPKPKDNMNNAIISSQYTLYPNVFHDNKVSTSAPPLLDIDSQQRLFESAARSRSALERLTSENFVPTQRWPRDDSEDASLIKAIFNDLNQLRGSANLNKLRASLKARYNLQDSVKSVPLRAFLVAYADIFVLESSHVYLRTYYRQHSGLRAGLHQPNKESMLSVAAVPFKQNVQQQQYRPSLASLRPPVDINLSPEMTSANYLPTPSSTSTPIEMQRPYSNKATVPRSQSYYYLPLEVPQTPPFSNKLMQECSAAPFPDQ